jgi:AraC-like DNA-binding protein
LSAGKVEEEMIRSEVGKPRGLLNFHKGGENIHLVRLAPSKDIQFFVEHYWIVSWDFRDKKPYITETLPHPSVHLTIEKGSSKVLGVTTGRFVRKLTGLGRVFGIKFRPGTFHPFFGKPLSTITDRNLLLRDVFGSDAEVFSEEVLSEIDERQCVTLSENFLRKRLPGCPKEIEDIRDLVERVSTDRSLIKAEQMAILAGVKLRVLQREFRKYVGVSPKWVLQRYRLHEAADQLVTGNYRDLATLAQGLGYFDQAHFIHDFKSMVGKTPRQIANSIKR